MSTSAPQLTRLRSMLICPGSDERKLTRAFSSDADAAVADFEDAVAPAEKQAARELVARFLSETESTCLRMVRINGVGTGLEQDDLAAIADLGLDAIMLPKADPDSVAALGPEGPPIIPIIETGVGLRMAYEVACMPRVAVLSFGAVDLTAALRLEPRRDGQELLYARSKLVVDSAAAGIPGPLDVVYLDVRDPEGLEAEARFVRSLGMRGKACIHPAQVEVVNRVFSPSEEELDWARRVVDAYEVGIREGRGAIALDGQMIDVPVFLRAQQVLADAEGH